MKKVTKQFIAGDAIIHDCYLGNYIEVRSRSHISESYVDDYSYVMNDCEIIYTRFGKFCSIAGHVRINPGQHPIESPALHHFTYRSEMFGFGKDNVDFFNKRKELQVVIDHDVWIGHGAVIMPGVEIGSGAVIGSNAVVTKNVEPFEIVAGVPSKKIRYRFNADVRQGLLKLCWWDWDREKIKSALEDFRSLSAKEFVEKYL